MIPLSTLYDDHSDWPKVTAQKNPFEYIVPLPLRWVETKIKREALYKALNPKKCNTYQLGEKVPILLKSTFKLVFQNLPSFDNNKLHSYMKNLIKEN